MNKWKIGFLLLLTIIIVVVVAGFIWMTSVPSTTVTPSKQVSGSDLVVTTTKEDVEQIANKYLQDALKDQPLPVELAVQDHILLQTTLTIFQFEFPVTMKFDPIVEDSGDLRLKQSSVEIGQLNIPPQSVLKLLKDSVQLPDWMVVRPDQEDIYVEFDQLPISSDVEVRAKTFDLKNNDIQLKITIPTNEK